MATNLDNLVGTGQLKREPPAQAEIDGLIHSGTARLKDAEDQSLSGDSRFDLACNAAPALALAALRWHGYRSENCYLVFQTLSRTVKLTGEQWRVLDTTHRKRNAVEYEGVADVDGQLIEAMIRVTREIASRVASLGPVEER